MNFTIIHHVSGVGVRDVSPHGAVVDLHVLHAGGVGCDTTLLTRQPPHQQTGWPGLVCRQLQRADIHQGLHVGVGAGLGPGHQRGRDPHNTSCKHTNIHNLRSEQKGG